MSTSRERIKMYYDNHPFLSNPVSISSDIHNPYKSDALPQPTPSPLTIINDKPQAITQSKMISSFLSYNNKSFRIHRD